MSKKDKEFIKDAFQAMIDRKVITEHDLEPSTVTDEMLDAFEQEMEVTLPSSYRTYLKTFSHSITYLLAAIPIDELTATDIPTMKQICELTADEILALQEEELPYLEEWYCEIFPIPKEKPLDILKEQIGLFRELATLVEDEEVTEESLKPFVPIANWETAGPLCIDTSKKAEDVRLDDPSTWQLRWFDHEEFHWKDCWYINEEGEITGDIVFPDFESFLKLYFYGVYEKVYKENES